MSQFYYILSVSFRWGDSVDSIVSTVLHLCILLQLEVSEPTTVGLYFNYVVTMRSGEVALFEAILDCQEFKLSWVPSCLRIFQSCRTYLDDATMAFGVLLVQNKPQAIQACIGHSKQFIAFLIWAKILKFRKVLNDIVKLLLV